MSQENVERLRSFFQRWDPWEWAKGENMSLFDPDLVYEGDVLPDQAGESYRGHEGLARATRQWLEPLEEGSTVELKRIIGLVEAGLALKVGEVKVRGRGGKQETRPVWDYQGISFHAFRHACGSLLFANGKSLKQVQGWLRHSQLSTTMNVYIDQVDDGLGSADAWDDILPGLGATLGATRRPETAANDDDDQTPDSAAQSRFEDKPQTAASVSPHS
jgi:hypothetical protein